MKNLVLFDIDGTLTESNQLDSICYVEVVKRVLDIDHVDDDWSHYHHVTDAGVLAEIYQEHFHKDISEAVASEFKEQFLQTIRNKLRSTNAGIRPVPGAREALGILRESDKWVIALAGGCWRESAEIKLHNARVTLNNIPIFSADDAIARTEIMSKAINTMLVTTGLDCFRKIVYVGDAVWDVKASRELDIAFLGVGAIREKLLAAGASHVISDYSDIQEFMHALNNCSVPTK